VRRRLDGPALAGLAATALVLGGCGGSGHSASSSPTSSAPPAQTSTTTAAHTTTASHTRTRHHPDGPTVKGPRVGARQGVHTGGAYLTVTILRVLDLTHTGSSVLPGTRQVAVELRIANQAGATYDSTSSGDVSLVLSHGQAEPLDVREGRCETPLVDFESHLYSGDVRDGCVAFSVPRHARIIGVRFSPHSRGPGTLSWRSG